MKILLYSINFSPELTGIGKYNGEMVDELLKNGVNLDIVTAPPYYPEWQLNPKFKNRWSKKVTPSLTIYRNPIYIPANLSTLKRLLHLCSFALSTVPSLVRQLRLKHDIIMLVQPTLFCAPATLLFCKLTGAKSIMHIQDYELDAMFGLGMMKEGKVARLAKSIECWLMKRFDAVSTISLSMIENAVVKGVNKGKIIYFPNWSDTNFVTPESKGNILKQQWGFEEQDKVILYAGNIGKKQGLEIVIEAAKHFENDKNIKFTFVGAGAHVDVLKTLVMELGLTNVYFFPLQPWERVPEMLALAHIHLVIQKKGAADAVLPSKLTNILSAGGHALVTAEPDTELGKLAERFKGIFNCIEPENTSAFILGLRSLLNKDLTTHNQVARAYAEEYLAKDKIFDKLINDLKQLVA
ncbi:MAG: colanic acid biosynthesis glycosyl transferase WcaI [Polaribacter sp.]|jgi:colanic acid biosynthesis glycosyl transferase WcaI